MAEMSEAVARLDERASTTFDDIDRRLEHLEGEHCLHPDEIDMAREIPAVKANISSLVKWRGWIMALVIVATTSLVGFAIASASERAETDQRVDSLEGDVEDIEDDIDDLESQLHQTREEILVTVRTEAAATREKVGTREGVDVEAVEAKLTRSERRTLRRLLRAASER